MSAVTPEAREQAIALAHGLKKDRVNTVDALIAAGWSPPVTPEAAELDPLPWIDMDSGVRFARQNRLTLGYTMLPRRIFDQDQSHYPEDGKP